MTAPRLAPFDMAGVEVLTLEPAPNGGWIVRMVDRRFDAEPEVLGAFTSGEDMLAALCGTLVPEPVTASEIEAARESVKTARASAEAMLAFAKANPNTCVPHEYSSLTLAEFATLDLDRIRAEGPHGLIVAAPATKPTVQIASSSPVYDAMLARYGYRCDPDENGVCTCECPCCKAWDEYVAMSLSLADKRAQEAARFTGGDAVLRADTIDPSQITPSGSANTAAKDYVCCGLGIKLEGGGA